MDLGVVWQLEKHEDYVDKVGERVFFSMGILNEIYSLQGFHALETSRSSSFRAPAPPQNNSAPTYPTSLVQMGLPFPAQRWRSRIGALVRGLIGARKGDADSSQWGDEPEVGLMRLAFY